MSSSDFVCDHQKLSLPQKRAVMSAEEATLATIHSMIKNREEYKLFEGKPSKEIETFIKTEVVELMIHMFDQLEKDHRICMLCLFKIDWKEEAFSEALVKSGYKMKSFV